MWIGLHGTDGQLPVIKGPTAEFMAASYPERVTDSCHRGFVVEWSLLVGVIALWERAEDGYRLLWESGAAEELRRRDEREDIWPEEGRRVSGPRRSPGVIVR